MHLDPRVPKVAAAHLRCFPCKSNGSSPDVGATRGGSSAQCKQLLQFYRTYSSLSPGDRPIIRRLGNVFPPAARRSIASSALSAVRDTRCAPVHGHPGEGASSWEATYVIGVSRRGTDASGHSPLHVEVTRAIGSSQISYVVSAGGILPSRQLAPEGS